MLRETSKYHTVPGSLRTGPEPKPDRVPFRVALGIVIAVPILAALIMGLVASCEVDRSGLATNEPDPMQVTQALDLIADSYEAPYLVQLKVVFLSATCIVDNRGQPSSDGEPGYVTAKGNCVAGTVPVGYCRQVNVAWQKDMTLAGSGLARAVYEAYVCGLYGSPRAYETDGETRIEFARERLRAAGL